MNLDTLANAWAFTVIVFIAAVFIIVGVGFFASLGDAGGKREAVAFALVGMAAIAIGALILSIKAGVDVGGFLGIHLPDADVGAFLGIHLSDQDVARFWSALTGTVFMAFGAVMWAKPDRFTPGDHAPPQPDAVAEDIGDEVAGSFLWEGRPLRGVFLLIFGRMPLRTLVRISATLMIGGGSLCFADVVAPGILGRAVGLAASAEATVALIFYAVLTIGMGMDICEAFAKRGLGAFRTAAGDLLVWVVAVALGAANGFLSWPLRLPST
jgi:hypothetical protein